MAASPYLALPLLFPSNLIFVLVFFGLQENFSQAHIHCQKIFLLSGHFIQVSPLETGNEKSFLNQLGNGEGWATAEIFTTLKGFFYLQMKKNKIKLNFKGINRKKVKF